MFHISTSDMTSAPPSSKQHSCLVPLHPGVCVSRAVASSSKPDHFDIKEEVCCSLSALRRVSWENDPARGCFSPRTLWSHLRGAVSAFLCDAALWRVECFTVTSELCSQQMAACHMTKTGLIPRHKILYN